MLHITIGTIVTAITIIAIVFLNSGNLFHSRDGVDGGYRLYARFKTIDGIKVGSKILLSGVPVGHVNGQFIDSDSFNAVISMHIDSKYQIPIDSAVMIVSDGFLGNKYIKIDVGGDFDMLVDGDEFEYIQDSVAFEEILEKIIIAAEYRRAAKKNDENNNVRDSK